MKKTVLMAVACASLLAGCATAPLAKSPEETAYLASLADEATEFDLPKTASDDGWGRAQVFLAKHSSMKVQTATSNLIENYTPLPNGFKPSYGYRVTRAPGPKGDHFSVECFNGNDYTPSAALRALPERNAKILARYIKTAQLPYVNLIAK